MKRFFLLVLLGFLVFPLSSAFAFAPSPSWYWGEDPSVDYTANYPSGTYWIWVPLTVVPAGYEWYSVAPPSVYYTGAAVYTGHDCLPLNSTAYFGSTYLNSTTYVPDLFALRGFGLGYLPDGSYTDDGFQSATLDLSYFREIDSQGSGFGVHPLNSFTVYVGDASQPPVVPEPASLSLFGFGLLGAFLKKKRAR